MRVLIIGGTGFIGPHVVRSLCGHGHEVTVFHRGVREPDLPDTVHHIHHPSLALGDRSFFADYQPEFRRLQPDVVLDMMAMTAQDAWALVHAVRGIADRVILASSVDVYRAYNLLRQVEDGQPEPTPLDEQARLRQRLYPYRTTDLPAGETENEQARQNWLRDYDKILVEQILLAQRDILATILRLPAVYGPLDGQHRLHSYIKRMDDGRPAILLDEGMADWRWSRGYVENVAHAITLSILNETAAGRTYNVGEATAYSETEWVRCIADQIGWDGAVVSVSSHLLPEARRQDYDWRHNLVVDSRRIRTDLAYQEPVPLAEALQRTIDWERSHPPSAIDAHQFDYAVEDQILAKLHD